MCQVHWGYRVNKTATTEEVRLPSDQVQPNHLPTGLDLYDDDDDTHDIGDDLFAPKEVMGMKEKEPMMDIDEVEEVDIENMTMEELKEFIAAAEAEAEVVGKD